VSISTPRKPLNKRSDYTQITKGDSPGSPFFFVFQSLEQAFIHASVMVGARDL
jgi:hypothetical protein